MYDTVTDLKPVGLKSNICSQEHLIPFNVLLREHDRSQPATDDQTNPKDLLGDKKVSLGQISPAALVHESMAMMDGSWKYGYRNWREKKVQARIYIDAALRHIEAWAEGEELAEDSGVHHLGHARACLGILLDAQENGNLIDNRVPGVFSKVLKRMENWVVNRKKLYENKSVPKSATTIGDIEYKALINSPCRTNDRPFDI